MKKPLHLLLLVGALGLTASADAVTTPTPMAAACTDGSVGSCTIAGCLKAARVCDLGVWGPCTCVIETCDDGNTCTTDSFNGTACVNAPRTGASCNDGNACTAGEVCTSTGACVGATVGIDDGVACTYDYCDATGVHHDVMASCPAAAPPPGDEAYSMPGTPGNPLAHAIPTMPGAGGPVVDKSTGVATMTYPIDLPRARGRYQPSLILGYSSGSLVDEGLGVGWSLNLSYIEADVSAPPAAGSSAQAVRWWISLNGARNLLVLDPQVPANANQKFFKTAVQGDLVQVAETTATDGSTTWQAKDVLGNSYDFTQHTGAGSDRIHLTKVTDVDGNETLFTFVAAPSYDKPNLLSTIKYNNYSVEGTQHFATSVNLDWLGSGTRRFRRFGENLNPPHGALSTIRIGSKSATAPGIDSTLIRYELAYQQSPKGSTSLLKSVTQFAGTTGKSLPPTEFTYGRASESFTLGLGSPFAMADAVDPSLADGEWIDLDADGLPDRVAGMNWQRNLTVRGSGVPVFASPQSIAGTAGLLGTFSGNKVTALFADSNGDGVADLLRSSTPSCLVEVRLGVVTSGAYSIGPAAVCLDASSVLPNLGYAIEFSLRTTEPGRAFADLTGDGNPLSYYRRLPRSAGVVLALRDINADGILDFTLRRDSSPLLFRGYGVPGLSPAGFSSGVVMDLGVFASGLDLNGDGLAGDYTYTLGTGTSAIDYTCFNTGGGGGCRTWEWAFDEIGAISVPQGSFTCPGADYDGNPLSSFKSYDDPRQPVDYVDLNGDGLPERISKSIVDTCTVFNYPFAGVVGATCMDPSIPTEWTLGWNTGQGFLNQDLKLTPKYFSANGEVDLPGAYPGVSFAAHGGNLTCDYVGGGTRQGTSTFKGWSAGFVDLDGDGVMDYVTNQAEVSSGSNNWMFFRGAVDPLRLSTVKTSAGATFAIQYSPSYQFGAGPLDGSNQVVTRLSVSGPGIPSASTSYKYAGPVHGASAIDPQLQTPRGFGTTWSWLAQPDATSAVAERMTWATGSSVLAGSPTKVEWGTFTGSSPSDGNFSPFRRVELAYEVRPGGSGSCLASGVEPPASAYPGLIPVVTSEVTTNILDDVQFASSRTRSCPADVDQFGNTLRTVFDPDTTSALDQPVEERASFEASATCKTCPTQVSVTALGGGTKLSESQFVYDSAVGTWNQPGAGGVRTGHLNYVRRWVSTEGGSSRYDVDVATAYNANGTVAYKVMDPYPMSHAVTTREYYTYDRQALRVTQTVTTSGTNTNCADLAAAALCKDVDYDSATGRPVREYGLYRSGTKVTSPPSRVEVAYDDFGRVVGVGRTASSAANSGNITLTGAISATEYVDSSPPVTKSYTFQAPLNLTLTAGAVPVRPDIKQVITYSDAFGRVTEVKERLGASGAADASSQIVQNLSGYRVLSHVQYDLAGRPVGALEPYFTDSEAQDSFDARGGVSTQRGAWTTYDERGRVTCVKAGVFTASKTGACASNFNDDTSHALATRFTFSALGGSATERRVAVGKAFGPSSSGNVASEARYTSDGLMASTADHYGNASAVVYDALGRVIETWREARGVANSRQRTTRTLDALGRVLAEWDDDWSPDTNPSRAYSYDAMGRAYQIWLPPQLVGPTKVRPFILRQYKSLGRLTLVQAREPSWQAGAAT